MNLLKSTGSKTLVECAYDRVWGSGVPLHEDNYFNETQWSGGNLLGTILMNVRGSIAAINSDNTPMDT